MERIAVGATLALAALSANAQVFVGDIPNPGAGFGGFVFAAYDDNASYSYYLGIDFNDFDPTVPGQEFALPNIDGVFSDINAVTWSIGAADGPGDPFFGGGQIYITTPAIDRLSTVNSTTAGAMIAELGNFITDTNIVCDEPFCVAANTDINYAGRNTYGDNLGVNGITTAVGFGEEAVFAFIDQLGIDIFGDGSDLTTVEALPFTWTFDGMSVFYGGGGDMPPPIPVPAGVWLLLSGVAVLGSRRRRNG